ncbi:MAG: hypothetical protein FWE92_00145 [Defluviitaleaceae bacterium]|nr:hypothetical protein [Defluviitaleaceae bacterium]
MYSTLINLFNENLDLTKRQLLDFPLREYHQKEHDKLRKQLDGMLNEDGQKLLDELLETSTHENQYYNYESFICGFRLAALLMVEVFHDKDNMLENREQYLRHLLNLPYRGTSSVSD